MSLLMSPLFSGQAATWEALVRCSIVEILRREPQINYWDFSGILFPMCIKDANNSLFGGGFL